MNRIFAATLIGLATSALCGITPASAQTAIQVAATEDISRGLEAQFQAAIIRERRLADDREQRMIADAEARLARARAEADARVAGAEAQLARARSEFASLVGQIAIRDSAARAEIAAYRSEVAGLAQRASPELLAAYSRFADGDRVGAWPIISELTQAQVRATIAGANARAAAQIRDAAQVRETMRLHGEATVPDVLALWTQAAQLDPSDFWTHIYRSRLLLQTGNLRDSWDAATRAGTSANSDYLRLTALVEIGDVAWAGGQWQRARQIYHDAMGFTRSLATDSESAENKLRLTQIVVERWARSVVTDDQTSVLLLRTFMDLARERRILPDRIEALAASVPQMETPPLEWLNRAEQLLQLNIRTDEARISALSNNADAYRQLSVSLSNLAYLYAAQSRWTDAEPLLRRALAIDQTIFRSTGGQTAALDLATDTRWIGDTLAAQRRIEDAAPLYRDALTLFRQAAATDPSNLDNEHEVAIALVRVGAISFLQRRYADARRSWSEASQILTRQHQAIPANESLATDNAIVQSLLGLVSDP